MIFKNQILTVSRTPNICKCWFISQRLIIPLILNLNFWWSILCQGYFLVQLQLMIPVYVEFTIWHASDVFFSPHACCGALLWLQGAAVCLCSEPSLQLGSFCSGNVKQATQEKQAQLFITELHNFNSINVTILSPFPLCLSFLSPLPNPSAFFKSFFHTCFTSALFPYPLHIVWSLLLKLSLLHMAYIHEQHSS